MLLKYISIKIFIISFIIGLLFVFFFGEEERKVYVYPTPQNITKIQYKDFVNNCFTFSSKEVKCPSDNSLISKIPIQI